MHGVIMRFKIIIMIALVFIATLLNQGLELQKSNALPLNSSNQELVSPICHLWPYGVPKMVKWSEYGLAVGTSAGYVFVLNEDGELKWSRKVNYTSVWSVAWSKGGELAVVTLGPPGALYIFNAQGDLLWSREWEDSQAYSVEWSDELLAVGTGAGLLVFNKEGNIMWNSTGSTLTASWYDDRIAAVKTVVIKSDGRISSMYWALQVFDKSGKQLWNYSGVYHYLAWSDKGYLAAADKYGGRVCMFDITGVLVWEKTVEMREIGALTWFGELLVVGGDGGILTFDKSGRIIWSYKGGFVEALSARGESLAIGDHIGNLTLTDVSGKSLWSYWTCGYVWSIDRYGNKIAATSSDGYVQVLDEEGKLLWKRRLGFNVEAVAINGNLIAVGGWDLNVTVLDLNGNLKWSRETGWVRHLAWHGDYLAVGGYEKTFVFRKDGSLVWEFDTGKVYSLSWSDDGLLAVGCTDKFGFNRLAVFGLDGKLLWNVIVPDWVLSISWSKELLAAAVAQHGIYVFDRNGMLKFVFISAFKDAKIPWRVSASWWGDNLIVVTDYVYALNREGKLLWINKFVSADIVVPGGDFIALGSGRGVSVLDGDGELEWSYLAPDYIFPKELYTKPYLQNVYSLAWVGGYLVVGDRLGRVFVFNETGDVIRVFDMGDAVWSISGDREVFAVGGGGGLLVARISPIERPLGKVLTQLPSPYNKFELAIANRTLLYLNGSLLLKPLQRISLQFEVSENAPYAFFEANLRSTRPIKFMLLMQDKYGELNDTSTTLSWNGTNMQIKVPLKPGKYSPTIISEEETLLYYTLHAYEGFLPFFEERRAYLPIGIADYGYAELPEGRIGYKYTFTEVWAHALITNISAMRPFDGDEEKYWVALQLNAFLHVTGEGARQVYWIQNVVVFDTLRKQARFASNIWNITTYPTSILAKWAIEGKGSLGRERRMGDYYFYNESWINYNYPLELALYLSMQIENGTIKLDFGGALNKEEFKVYDTVTLKVKANSAYFKVDPTEHPLPSNLEFVFTGPHGGKPKTIMIRIEANLKLLVNVGGDLIPIPTAYSCGYATYERIANANVKYGGNYTVTVTSGKTKMLQVYYSTSTFTPIQVVVVRDPLKIYSKLLFLKMGESLPLPTSHMIDLGNKTRYLLKGYTTMGREVTLEWVKQFYLEVVSEYGSVEGGGWYNESSYARVKLKDVEVGFLIRQVFERWEGLGLQDKVLEPGVVDIYMNGPRKLVAVWKTDYTQLIILTIIIGATLTAIAYYKLIKHKSIHSYTEVYRGLNE